MESNDLAGAIVHAAEVPDGPRSNREELIAFHNNS